ncbi:MAG: polysaccharide biosynthesis tyrosine autokinase, partial [Acidobacteriota bacterium]
IMEVYPNNEQPFAEKEVDLLDYWRVVWKRRWTVAALALVVIAVAAFKTFTVRPAYTAKGTLLIEKEPNILTFEEIFQIETFRDDYYQTQYKLLQSRALAENVIERLKLPEKIAAESKPKKGKPAQDPKDPAFRRSVIDSFQGRIEVGPVRLTRLVEVTFKDSNSQFAADAVNALFDSFIDMNVEAKYEATEQATEFLTGQIASLRSEIESKEKELQNYGAEKNIIALSDKETTIIDKLGDLNRALTEAQIDRVKKEAYYNEIKNVSPDYFPETLTNPLIQRLREDDVRLSREYMKKSETFRPDYPEMQRLKTELESARNLLEAEAKNLIKAAYSDYQAALNKEKSLEGVFNKQKQEAFQLNSNAIAYNSLRIELENKKNMHESLLRRQSETGVAARLRGLRTANIRVVDRAQVPLSPSSPRTKLNLILALIIGLFGGVGLAFLFEYLDNSVKTSEDVERYGRLPSLGVVPEFSMGGFRRGYGYGYGYGYGRKKKKERGPKKMKIAIKGLKSPKPAGSGDGQKAEASPKETESPVRSIELIAQHAPKSSFTESYRLIRTALLLSSANPETKAIVVSSPLPSEGKTATIGNVAVTLAQAEKRVLVVDSDLRKPRQHRIFGIKNLDGLTNYLTKGVELKDLIKPTRVPNLFLINSGPVPPNPTELLGSEKMGKLVKELRQYFQCILFDSPPLLVVTDALALAPHTDGLILVVWGGKTPRESLRKAREQLDLMKIKPLGAIINHLNIRDHSYYYKDHYYHQHYYGEQ